jgi:TrmH family RNA methyltransferase
MISSSSNPLIKQIRKLRERKFREETRLFFVEGTKLIGEAFSENWGIDRVIFATSLIKGEFGKKLIESLIEKKIEMVEVSSEVFRTISLKDGPQGIGVIIRSTHYKISSLSVGDEDVWIALDEVQDPGNLGTILRTSDAVGAKGIILLDHSTDPYDPATVRASMGAMFSQKIIECSLEEFGAWKRKNNIAVVGTSGNSEIDYHTYRYSYPMILLMGSERQGLSVDHIKICDKVVKIPMVGKSDSLNLAIATGIVLYEIFNQKREAV